MDIKFPLENTIETPLDLEKVFTDPESLRTARALVKLMMREMDDKHPRSTPASQQAITKSFHISRPISELNPTMPNTLKQGLTFSDSHSQTFGEVNRRADLSGDKSDSLERVEYSHVKLVPSSNAGASLSDLYFSSRSSSHTEQDNSKTHTYFQSASSTTPSSHKFPPLHENSSALTLDDQSENQIGTSRSIKSEVQHGNSYTAIPLLNTIRHSLGGLSYSSNLASIDRDFLGFSTMYQAKKSTALSTTKSRHPTCTSNGRPQNSLLTPQPYKPPRLCMQHSFAVSHPQLASKSLDDREMLQVVQSQAPRNSPVAEATAAHSSSSSTDGTKQVKKSVPRKRKIIVEDEPAKKQKLDKTAQAKRTSKPKREKRELAKYRLDHVIWMRILEFCPVQFLGKARLICNEFKGMVDQFTSIYVNCRKENYGHDMPPPPLGLTERQYTNLLGSKGCLEPGCTDKHASRTHWSWAKRWCSSCWKNKIERADRLIKNRGDRFSNRTTLTKLLECIPVGMHDSFMKPHDYVDVDDNRPRGAPRLYKYYLKEDVERIFREYDNLDPEPYEEDTAKSAEENAAALAHYQDLLAGLDNKRAEFLAERKAEIDEHMVLVQKIEAAVKKRRETKRTPYDENRNARKQLFTRRAREELPHIDEDFVKSTAAFKAATRVFRDGGTERGWQTLKPKIEKEWERSREETHGAAINDIPQLEGATDIDQRDEHGDDAMQMDIDNSQPMSVEHGDDAMQMDIDNCQTMSVGSHSNKQGNKLFPEHLENWALENWARTRIPPKVVPPAPHSFITARNVASTSLGYNPQLPLAPSMMMVDPAFRAAMTPYEHLGSSRSSISASLAFSNSGHQSSFSSSHAPSIASSSTGNSNESRGPMSITSLLTSNSYTSHLGNSS